MGKMTVTQKAQRVLRFLMGLQTERAAQALADYGFNDAELDEGWFLLRAATINRLAVVPRETDASMLLRLDEWENRWLVVGEAGLRRRFPAVADKVFLNLSRTTGPEVVVSVTTFVERVEALGATDEDKAARELLTQRGLTQAVIDEAKAMLASMRKMKPPVVVTPPDPEALEQAEAALWSWYRDWSAIARIAIQDRRILASLGFTTRRSASGDEELVDDGEVEPPTPSSGKPGSGTPNA
jgi:hypothetical protein